jgi:hypothetical protein
MGSLQQRSGRPLALVDRTTRNTVAVIGPSTAFKWGHPVSPDHPLTLSTPGASAEAATTAASLQFWLDGAMQFVYNAGVSGDTSATILARTAAAIAAAGQPAFWVLLDLDGNDPQSFTQVASLANMQAICEQFDTQPGYKVLPTWVNLDAGMDGTLAKAGGGFFTPTEWAEWVRASDAWKREWVVTHSGWLLADVHAEVTRSNLYRTNYSADKTHPTNLGGDYVARPIAKAMRSRFSGGSGLAVATDASNPFGDGYFLRGTPTDSFQTITLGGASGGTFTLTMPANSLGVPAGTTAAITVAGTSPSYAGTAANVLAALQALVGVGNVAVGGLTVEFIGAYAGQTVPLMTLGAGGLTGASGATVTNSGSGGAPAGWLLIGNSNIKASVEARDDGLGNWLVLEAVANGAGVTLVRSVGSTFSTGVKMCAEMEIRVDKTWVNPTRSELYLNFTTPLNITSAAMLASGKSPDPLCFNPGPSQHPLRTPYIVADRNYTVGNVFYTFGADSGSVVRVGRIGSRIAT